MRNLVSLSLLSFVVFTVACSTPSSTEVKEDSNEAPETHDGKGTVDAVIFPEIITKDTGSDFAMDFGAADTQADTQLLNCQPGEGCFLDECSSNAACQSGWCVEHLGDGVCTKACQDECPAGWTCQQIAGTEPDVVFVCVSDYANLCKPCASNGDCGTVGKQDVCLDYGDEGSFCGGSCEDPETGSELECPWGFTCLEKTTVDGGTSKQCVSDTGSCPCTDKSISLALSTPCTIENDIGLCAGHRICTDGGLSDCNAKTPALEECNGADDNCDGLVDEATCDDGIQCTMDSCDPESGCVHETLDNGECTDGNPCTVADHCVDGECVGSPVLCDDSNSCTDDSCAEEGGCIFTANQDDCDDVDPCTVGDHCKDALCVGTDIDCGCTASEDCAPLDNGDICDGVLYCDTSSLPFECAIDPETVVECPAPEGSNALCLKSVCDPLSGDCSSAPDHEGIACDDGDGCTIGETCTEGECGGGGPLNCNDGNVCTDDLCDAVAGCQYNPNDNGCQDGSICTVGDACSEGDCLAGKALECDDDNPCTDDTCNPESGCVYTPNQGACTDNNPCTSGDHCEAGKCVPAQMLDCDDQNPCTDDSCDANLGCIHDQNEAPCDDGNECTSKDVCDMGWCLGVQVSCDDGNTCTNDSCDPKGGCQYENNEIFCSDGSVCTSGDQCQGGECVGEELDCDDENLCTDDTCGAEFGCLHKLNSAACDDGDVCTANDHCQGGQCAGGDGVICNDEIDCTTDSCEAPGGCTFVPKDLGCNDGNNCTDDVCDPNDGCVHTLNEAPCEDGNPCTEQDACNAGICVGGPQATCDDGNVCTEGSCDGDAGCLYTPVAGDCDDDDSCTNNDSCQLGECVGAPLPCDDDVACTTDQCTAEAGCVSTPVDDFCDDDNVCTTDICDAQAGCTYAPAEGDCDGGSCDGGQCVPACVPDCNGKECGADGCDDVCGTCDDGFNCSAGSCVEAGSDDCNDGNDILWDGCTEGKITEYRVNTFTPGDQTYPDVAGLSNGRHVIVWQSYDQDGEYWGVYGQLFDSDGTAMGDEFQANAYTTHYQYWPRVAALGEGKFMVVWQSYNNEGDNKYHAFSQRYNADGSKDGTETRLDGDLGQNAEYPVLAGRTDGSIHVAWNRHTDGSGHGLFGRSFDGSGNALTGNVLTNSYTGSHQERGDVVGHPGGYIVVWQSNGQDGSNYGPYGQRLNTVGAKVGSEFKVHTYTQSYQRYPRVGAYDNGAFVAVWESTNEDASGTGVYCQRFKADATKINNPFRVNTYIVGSQEKPDVSAWSDGRFVVVWYSYNQDGENGGIFGQRYNSDGTPAGKEFQVNSYTAYEQRYPAISTVSGAGFIVTWNSQAQDGSVSGVFAQRYDAAGNKLYH
jgi:hypothetical protein